MGEKILKIVQAAVLSILLVAAVLCTTVTIKLMDLILRTGIKDIRAAGIKAGFVAWIALSVMILVWWEKKKQEGNQERSED